MMMIIAVINAVVHVNVTLHCTMCVSVYSLLLTQAHPGMSWLASLCTCFVCDRSSSVPGWFLCILRGVFSVSVETSTLSMLGVCDGQQCNQSAL